MLVCEAGPLLHWARIKPRCELKMSSAMELPELPAPMTV